MVIATQSMIEISAFVRNGNVVIPAFRISADIGNWGARALDVYKEAPTLAQLRYADSASNEIKENIRSHRYRGEFTADFVDYNATKPKSTRLPKGFLYAELVQRPESVRQENGVWIAEGGRRIGLVMPPDGYQVPDSNLRYNPETGFPIRTLSDRDKAIKELSKIMPAEEAEKEVSYFLRWDENQKRLSPVSRGYDWPGEPGPSYVGAGWGSPSLSSSGVGSRVVRENVYKLDVGSYRKLVEGLQALQGNIAPSGVPDLAKNLLDILSKASE